MDLLRSREQHYTVTVAKCFGFISRLSKHPVTTVRGEGGIGAPDCQGAWVVVRLAVERKVGSWILTSLNPHRVTSSSRQILHCSLLHQFKTKSPVESWITVLTQQMQSTVKSKRHTSQKQAHLIIYILTSYNPQKHIIHKGPPPPTPQFRTCVPSGFLMHNEEIFVDCWAIPQPFPREKQPTNIFWFFIFTHKPWCGPDTFLVHCEFKLSIYIYIPIPMPDVQLPVIQGALLNRQYQPLVLIYLRQGFTSLLNLLLFGQM